MEFLCPQFVRANNADVQAINALFDSEKIDTVVNLVAEAHVDRSFLDRVPFLRTNVEGIALLGAASRYGVSRFVHVSTDEVYGSLDLTDPQFTEQTLLQLIASMLRVRLSQTFLPEPTIEAMISRC